MKKSNSGKHLSSLGEELQRVYDPTVEEVLPFRFGKALGAVFLATTDLKAFAAAQPTPILTAQQEQARSEQNASRDGGELDPNSKNTVTRHDMQLRLAQS